MSNIDYLIIVGISQIILMFLILIELANIRKFSLRTAKVVSGNSFLLNKVIGTLFGLSKEEE